MPTGSTLFVILGPTAVGKTALSLALAKEFEAPILNADSRQIYRDIPIGTAAPTQEELARAVHYFVGRLALTEYYSAAQYEAEALSLLTEIFKEHRFAILSGGSMLYIDAVCNGIDDIPNVDAEVRTHLARRLSEEGVETMAEELRIVDPDYYSSCDRRNPKRVVHALEVYYTTGRPLSSFFEGGRVERPFRIVKIGLRRERSELFSRINQRTDTMMQLGWLDEVRRVEPFRHCNSLNTVGYKELFHYLDGDWSLDFALQKIQRNTRVYAKKQMTWFSHDQSIHWFHPDEVDEILDFCRKTVSDVESGKSE